jgi:cytochrome c nitrite reductase small subunit
MGSYYQSWAKSSHFVWTNCNDCHVPQDKFLRKWAFKATDGLYHAYAFTMGLDKEIIRAREGTYQVLQENCLRCHSPLVTEFTKMSPDYASVTTGEKKACWDCHRDTPHTTVSSTTSINYGGLPIPASPAPDWLEAMIGDKPQ